MVYHITCCPWTSWRFFQCVDFTYFLHKVNFIFVFSFFTFFEMPSCNKSWQSNLPIFYWNTFLKIIYFEELQQESHPPTPIRWFTLQVAELRSFICVSHLHTGTQTLGPSCPAFPRPLAGSWIESWVTSTRTGAIWDVSITVGRLYSLCHNASPPQELLRGFGAHY